MDTINQGAKQANVDARLRTMMIVWFAMLMSVGTFFVIAQLVERPATAEANGSTLVWILLALGIMTFLGSFLIKRNLLAQSVREQQPGMVQSAMIVALALCESTSLFGLLAYFATGTRYYYIFFIIGVIGTLLHMPRRDQLLAASYKS
jgi:F0F1-type ATP synthase membrane subunit c/vacuolar-type H+-ATPase subunit K